jgi:hypothetical protein
MAPEDISAGPQCATASGGARRWGRRFYQNEGAAGVVQDPAFTWLRLNEDPGHLSNLRPRLPFSLK